jgi:4'-phosphopantetheinyl transferase EntD
MSLISAVVPTAVSCAELFDDPPDVLMFDDELIFIARAVEKRRREFTSTRHCARQALAALGHPPVPLLPGEGGAPQWPTGVIGSMTHCKGYRAAAVSSDSTIRGIGIDAEPHEYLPDNIITRIALPREQQLLAVLAATDSSVHWSRLLFSCKESLYKAWFPLTHRWLGFEDASITIDPATGTFSAELLVEGPAVFGTSPQLATGRWLIRQGLIVTAVIVQDFAEAIAAKSPTVSRKVFHPVGHLVDTPSTGSPRACGETPGASSWHSGRAPTPTVPPIKLPSLNPAVQPRIQLQPHP